MENNYFISALTNYVDSLPNKKDAYYMGSNCINYYTLVNFLFTDMILCNNIMSVNDNYLYSHLECGNDEEVDFYQYYIVNIDNWRFKQYVSYCKAKGIEPLTVYYLDELDLYILAVDHCGTSWDYVTTDIQIDRKEA